MTIYDQHMKHWKNHSNDKFFQQCSGYFGDGNAQSTGVTPEQEEKNSKSSMSRILSEPHEYPVYLHQINNGVWEIVTSNYLFGQEINNEEELLSFAEMYS